jgi:chorismate mutase
MMMRAEEPKKEDQSTSKKSLVTVFGPCSAESREQVLEVATQIAQYFPETILRAGIWKPRTRPGSFEGAGSEALNWMLEAREQTGLRICTEVATPAHVEAVLEKKFDMVWIGARTTVNPFLVQELAEALRGSNIPVMVKNPINPDLGLWIGAIERFQAAGIQEISAIHRGFQSFETEAYRYSPRWDLVIDFKSRMPSIPVLCDASHISGDRNLLAEVAQKALDLDYHGLMIETHPNPDEALSDAKQQISPAALEAMVRNLVLRTASTDDAAFGRVLAELRYRVDAADDLILQGLITRQRLIEQIGSFKKDHDVMILQLKRWEEILKRQVSNGTDGGLDATFVKRMYELIHEESIRIQTGLFNS